MRGLFIVLSFVVLISSGYAKVADDKGLPYEVDTKNIKINKIPRGNQVTLEFDLQLPKTQGLNKGAPSFVGIYEKTKNSVWQQTAKIDLNSFLTFSDQIHFSKNITLNSDSSEVAVFSTIYHCGKDHKTPCYIQGFKGKTTRSAKAISLRLPVYIQGTMR